MEKEDYFRMREGFKELVTQIDDLLSLITELLTIIHEPLPRTIGYVKLER